MVEQVRENTGRSPEELSADAGYCSKTNLLALEEQEIEAFIPPEQVKHSRWRDEVLAVGEAPALATLRDRMRHKPNTEHGRERYRRRMTSVEPVFGQIKEPMGFRQVLLRGQVRARSLWRFQSAAFNVMKMYRRKRRPGREAALAATS